LNCPFTVLTATLIVQLEGKLRDQLLIPDAVLFRRSTVRPTIQYQVVDSQKEMPSKVGIDVVRRLGPFPDGKREVVYVRSYATGETVSEELDCPFYKATADQKSEVLEEWRQGSGGWIVATGALGTGINIAGIIYVVHIDRPYGLTSFVQQSGRRGRGGGSASRLS
jgi:superfamily II DNA helicase RecQ